VYQIAEADVAGRLDDIEPGTVTETIQPIVDRREQEIHEEKEYERAPRRGDTDPSHALRARILECHGEGREIILVAEVTHYTQVDAPDRIGGHDVIVEERDPFLCH